MTSAAASRRGIVLAVADHPWPRTSGGQLRTARIAEVLAEWSPLTVVSLTMPDPPASLALAIERYWARRLSQPTRVLDLARGAVLGNHVSLQRATAAGLPQAFEALLADLRPALVVLGRPFFGRFVTAARRSGAHLIIDPDESLERVNRSVLRSRSSLAARARALADLPAVARMERRDFHLAEELWTSSPIEARALARIGGSARVRLVPNVSEVPSVVQPPEELRQVAFVAYFRHPPNEEAALELITEIMPVVRAAGGPRELVLIGREPTERMQAVAASIGEVTITGEVPDTNVPLRHAGVLVAPVRSGGGTRLKVVEAIAAGVPVVATRFCIEGLRLQPGRDVLVAEEPAEFAAAIRRLQDEQGLTASLVTNARDSVEAHHSIDALRRAISVALSDVGVHSGTRSESPSANQ